MVLRAYPALSFKFPVQNLHPHVFPPITPVLRRDLQIPCHMPTHAYPVATWALQVSTRGTVHSQGYPGGNLCDYFDNKFWGCEYPQHYTSMCIDNLQ